MSAPEAIVIGLGALGAATLEALARAGVRALGIDAHPVPHRRGASHGDTRLIRHAYFEDPRYVPLADAAAAAWRALEARTGAAVYHPVGLVVWGEGATKLEAMVAAGEEHGVPLEHVALAEARRRFPRIAFPEEGAVVREPGAGYLRVEAAQAALLDSARAQGAEVRAPATVQGWETQGQGFSVRTEGGELRCQRLFVCAGAWVGRLIPDLPFPLRLWRAPQVWFAADAAHQAGAGMPCFAFDTAEGFFYGFPATDRRGVKVAAYDPVLALADPDEAHALTPEEAELGPLRGVVARFLPGLGGVEAHEMCMFTCSPDEDFLVAEHPAHPGLHLLAADSGHAYKFAPALAEALVAQAYGREPGVDVSFLGWRDAG